MDEKGKITSELVNARGLAGNFVLAHVSQSQYMDVSPKQLVSVAASLIPFLENDDANRALMGSNYVTGRSCRCYGRMLLMWALAWSG